MEDWMKKTSTLMKQTIITTGMADRDGYTYKCLWECIVWGLGDSTCCPSVRVPVGILRTHREPTPVTLILQPKDGRGRQENP